MNRLLSVGYATIDKINDCELFGGAAAGIAVNGRNLGLETALLSVLGEDSKSQEYITFLDDAGVDISQVQISPYISIPMNYMSHEDRVSGWRDNGARLAMAEVEVESHDIQSFDAVHLASAESSLVNKVISKSEQKIISFSPGPKLASEPAYLNIEALSASDITFLNDEEWLATKGKLGLENVSDLMRYGSKVIVVSHGAQGVDMAYEDGGVVEEHIDVPAFDDPETTGAGDALALGFLSGYMNRLPVKTCGEVGILLAYQSLKSVGVIIEPINIANFVSQSKNLFALNV